MTAAQLRRNSSGKEVGELSSQGLFGISICLVSRCWQRALGFQELATAISGNISELHKRVEGRIERLLGQPLPRRRRRRIYQVLGIEQLEARMLLSVTWGDSDGIFTWQDADGDTQAIDVTNGDVEIHFDDDVANTGNITEIRLMRNNTGFDISTTDIDLIDSNGFTIGVTNIGVDVGGELADLVGTVDVIRSDRNLTHSITVNGSVGDIFIDGNLTAELIIAGDVGSITVTNNVNDEITIGGDLDSFTVNGQFNGLLRADQVEGLFNLSDTFDGYNFSHNFTSATQITYDGSSVIYSESGGDDDGSDDFVVILPVFGDAPGSGDDFQVGIDPPVQVTPFIPIDIIFSKKSPMLDFPDPADSFDDFGDSSGGDNSETDDGASDEGETESPSDPTQEGNPVVESGNSQSENFTETASISAAVQQDNAGSAVQQDESVLRPEVLALLSTRAKLTRRLDEMREKINPLSTISIPNITVASSTVLTAGYVIYDFRKLCFFLSAISALPQWRQFDLMSVLNVFKKNNSYSKAMREEQNPLLDIVCGE